MKKKIVAVGLFCLSLGMFSGTAIATEREPVKHEITIQEEVQELIGRIREIQAMDKSDLSPAERKALRKEVKEIEKRLRDIGGGVYISAGALILIVILLIIFL